MTITSPQLLDVDQQVTAVIRGRVPVAELPAFFDRSFGALAAALARQGVTPAGPAFARYDGPPTDVAQLEVGFPTATPIEADGDAVPSALPAGRVARTVHAGGFDGLGDAWGALGAWIADHGEAPGDVMWEVYVTEPSPAMDPSALRTELSWLLG